MKDYAINALLFPGIPLLFLVYANISLQVGARLRVIINHDNPQQCSEEADYLMTRLRLIRLSIIMGGVAFVFNILSLISIYFNYSDLAELFFALAAISLTASVCNYIYEVLIETRSLSKIKILLTQNESSRSRD